MSAYYPIYEKSQESFTLKYGTTPDTDIEAVLESIVAYKKLIQRSILIISGDSLKLNQNILPDLTLSINKHYKGSDFFDLFIKLTPEKYQQRALISSIVILGIGSAIFATNQILDLYIKLGQINQKNHIESEFEDFKKEINNKIKNINQENSNYSCPTSPLMVIDYTLNDYEDFIKPIKNGNSSHIDILQNGKIINHFDFNNTRKLNLDIINEEIISTNKTISFTAADITNNKKWKVLIDNERSISANIKHKQFYEKLRELEDNIFQNKYESEITEYWKREKGEESLKLSYIDINKIIGF